MVSCIEGPELTLVDFDNMLGIFKEKIIVLYCSIKNKFKYIYHVNVAMTDNY